MKYLAITLLIVLAIMIIANVIYVAPPINPGKPLAISQSSPEDHQAFQALADQMISGWNTGNGKLYAEVFTEDADYIAFNGERFTGRKAIAESHQELFDGFLKGSSLEDQHIIDIRFLSDETAIVLMTGYVKKGWRKKAPESRKSIQTLTAVKKNGEWKFASFHNSRIQRFTIADGITMLLK